jgi:hypothetical protein
MTREHIIPESMGGKKTVRGFICRDCNSRTGYTWDVAVSNFETWMFLLNPDLSVNPRGEKPLRVSMGDTGLNAYLDSRARVRLGFNPPVKSQKPGGIEVYEFVEDPSRVDDLFKSVNRLLQRKGKNPMTREEFDAGVSHQEVQHPSVNFTLEMDMPKYFRSLVKTAMAMAFSVGVKPTDCENAVRYLRGESMDENGVVGLPDMSLEGLIDDWINYHAVTVFGIPNSRSLMGEVLYFGRVAALVFLSDSYEGPTVIAGHAINLKTGESEDADLNLPDLVVPESLLKARIERFKSPAVLRSLVTLRNHHPSV